MLAQLTLLVELRASEPAVRSAERGCRGRSLSAGVCACSAVCCLDGLGGRSVLGCVTFMATQAAAGLGEGLQQAGVADGSRRRGVNEVEGDAGDCGRLEWDGLGGSRFDVDAAVVGLDGVGVEGLRVEGGSASGGSSCRWTTIRGVSEVWPLLVTGSSGFAGLAEDGEGVGEGSVGASRAPQGAIKAEGEH